MSVNQIKQRNILYGFDVRFTDTIVGKEMENKINENSSIRMSFVNYKISNSIYKLVCIFPILMLCIVGCSDVPYTGPVLTVDSVDRYLNSTGEDTICLQDGFDTICLKVVGDESQEAPPIVHIHPASVAFMFYYEDRPVLRAEKVMNTTELIQELVDSGQVQLPAEDVADGATNNQVFDTSGEWIIEVYYPDGFPDKDRGTTPESSGLDIRVGEEKKLSAKTKDDLEIMNFKQIDRPDGIRGVQFTVESEDADISIEVNGIIDGHTAIFYIKADGLASEENIYTFQLQPNDGR